MADNEVRMMMSVVPGAMTGFAALNAGLVSINNVFGAMTRSIDAQFGLVNTAIMTTGVVVTQLGVDAMNAFGQFEQGMKIVQMVSGQTSDDISLLKQKANEFSVQYRMDIDQLTEGLQTLGRAGLNSASEQAEVLENGLYTAKLEGRDLKGVLEELIQTTALLGGDLKSSDFGEQSGYVEDLMVATSMTAPITTHDVNETLKYSGGIAAAAGANLETEEGKRILEDYMGSIAAFAQKGVTGSIAGTALRAFFNKPATQDSSVKEALATIKLKPEYLWEDDEETMKPVSEQIGLIQKQMDDLNISTMDRLQIWSKIVGGKMGQQMMKLDSDDIKELTKDIQSADSASSLAAGSMRTYEANIKAVSETGASLQRNVGERLVFFANPILELLGKIANFLNNDVTATVLAGSVLAFIGLAGRKAMGVVKALKAEISTLYAGMKAQQQYFTQKQGVVRVGDNPLDDQKAKAKAWFEAREEYYGKKKEAKESGGKGKSPKSVNEMTAQEFQKSLWKQSSQPTVAGLRKAGWTDTEIGLSGRMATLKKDSFGIGMSDAQFANFLGRHHILTEAQQAEVNKLLSTTSGARGPFNQLFMNEKGTVRADIAEQIRKNEAAMKELGWTIQEETPSIEKNHQAQLELQKQYQLQLTTMNDLIAEKQIEAQKEVEIKQTKQANQQTANQNEIKTEQTKYAEKQTNQQTAAQNEIKTEQTKQSTILNTVTLGSQQIIDGVAAAMTKLKIIMAENAIMPGTSLAALGYRYPYDKQGIPLTYSQNLSLMFGNQYGNVNEAIRKGYTPLTGQMPWFMTQFNTPRDLFKNGVFQFSGVTEADIRAANAAMYHGGGIGFYGALNKLGMGNETVDSINKQIVPNALKRGQEAIRNRQPPSPSVSEDTINNARNIAKNAVRNTVGDLGIVKYGYGEKELELHKQGLAVEQEILIARRQGAETASQNAYQKKVGTEKDRQKFQEERTKGNLITSRKDIDDIRRQAKEDFNKKQRNLSTERDRQKFQEERIKGSLITSRNEIDKIREDSKKQFESTKAAANYVKSFSNQTNNIGAINQALGKYGNQITGSSLNQQTARILNENQNVLKQIQSNPRIVGTNYANDPRWANFNGGYGLVGDPKYKSGGSGFGSAFAKNFSERLNRDRTGSFLSFGSTTVNGVTRSATRGLSGLANKALNLTDAFGGPLMIAIMAVTTAIQMWQKAFQDYCEDLKEAGDKLNEAYSNLNTAEDNLRETFKKGNSDATDEEIDQMIYDTYATMSEDMANAVNNGAEEWFKKLDYKTDTGTKYEYDEEKDDGSIKEKEEEEKSDEESYEEAIKENTGALYTATAEVNKALDNYVIKANDGMWGLDGWTGWISDEFGGAMNNLFDLSYDNRYSALPTLNLNKSGASFTDNQEFLLTASQSDENYAGYKEMAGLMMEDFKDARGNWVSGLRTMMGNDVEDLSSMFTRGSKTETYLRDMANFSAGKGVGGLTANQNAKIQSSMKNDTKSWSKLAKELAKRDSAAKAGKNIEKQQKKINGIAERIRNTLGTGFSKTQVLQAAYLVQLQEMKSIADQSIVPIMQTNMQTAMNTLSVSGQIDSNTSSTVGTTDGTYQNAAIIAGLVAIIAKAQAKTVFYDTAVAGSTQEGHITDVDGSGGQGDETDKRLIEMARESDNADDFYKKYMQDFDAAIGASQDSFFIDLYKGKIVSRDDKLAGGLGYLRLYESTAKMEGYDYSPDQAADTARKFANYVKQSGIPMQDALKTAEKNYTMSDSFKQKIIDAYNASGNEEEGSGSDTGSGSGDNDNDKDTGTKKERVDLVLCSKKEIPKLNVNLFKKPPTFTILNKNFKLRDVKINTEDTPKAIMSSIKNAFIDVQKRSDPKIIQDEEGVYDPEGATEGNPLPSGTARTRTE